MSISFDAPQEAQTILAVEDLEVSYGMTSVLRSFSFTLHHGERLAVVGESGSGKSTAIGAVLGLLPPGGHITHGQVRYRGQDLTAADETQFRALRGRSIALIPQDPMTNLNPTMRVGDQIADALRASGMKGRREVIARVEALMAEAGIPEPARRRRQYPHEFSGGMRQRVLIAIALAGEPDLIIADEPTSALDVTVQKQILDHLEELVAQRAMALLFVTHDLGVAADRTDTILVMSRGEVVERGTPRQVLGAPQHAYTRQLVAAAPVLPAAPSATASVAPSAGPAEHRPTDVHRDQPSSSPTPVDAPEPVLEVRNLVKDFTLRGQRTSLRAVDHVSFAMDRGTTTAVIGESGSGKSTLARIALGLDEPTSGEVFLGGQSMSSGSRADRKALRRFTQPVFQDPYTSLNPYWTIESVIREPLRLFRIGDRTEQRRRVRDVLGRVALSQEILVRHPGELSGGQRQRVAIARALVSEPELLICDEAVSALDVLVQAQVLELLTELRAQMGVSCLFITHDLAVAADFSDDVVVMKQGRLIEAGHTEQVISRPEAEYTRSLVDAMPGRGLAGV